MGLLITVSLFVIEGGAWAASQTEQPQSTRYRHVTWTRCSWKATPLAVRATGSSRRARSGKMSRAVTTQTHTWRGWLGPDHTKPTMYTATGNRAGKGGRRGRAGWYLRREEKRLNFCWVYLGTHQFSTGSRCYLWVPGELSAEPSLQTSLRFPPSAWFYKPVIPVQPEPCF